METIHEFDIIGAICEFYTSGKNTAVSSMDHLSRHTFGSNIYENDMYFTELVKTLRPSFADLGSGISVPGLILGQDHEFDAVDGFENAITLGKELAKDLEVPNITYHQANVFEWLATNDPQTIGTYIMSRPSNENILNKVLEIARLRNKDIAVLIQHNQATTHFMSALAGKLEGQLGYEVTQDFAPCSISTPGNSHLESILIARK